VRAAGLNFRDLMWASGALPEEAVEDGFAGAALGMELAGVVTRAGPGARFAAGDAVMGFARGSLASATIAADSALAPIPEGLDFAAAASMPVVYGTALHALVELARIEAGEVVLVHGGAGGVGLAALQIARSRGARVFATAGTPAKRSLLRLLGAEAVFDSRGLDFAAEALALTDGRGIDVALNSLAGEAMERTLEIMAPFGRFVELGKRDFYANTRIGLRPLRRNVAYFGADLDALLAARPQAARALLDRLGEEVAAGRIAPIPHRVFGADEALDAFRLMQRAGHLGKIVLSPPEVPQEIAEARPVAAPRADAAYLVVGGAAGFGLRFAERLVRRGARRIWLTSASGETRPEDEPVYAAIGAAGADVEVCAVDAADAAAMAALLDRIEATGAPLAGVAHAATRMDDGLMAGMDADRLAAALRPKLDGALVLDRLTRGRPLDFFLMFSSVSALFGNPGQGAYVAANAALEALAAERRRAGEPALAVGFGPISDAGMLAREAGARALLERRGARLMTSVQALDRLEAAMAGAREPALTIAPMRWGALAAELPVVRGPLFERVEREGPSGGGEGTTDLRALIAGLDDDAASVKLARIFRDEAAAILRQPPEEVDVARPMSELGFDSLMAVELKLSAEEKYGVTLPILSLADGATLHGLALRVARELRAGDRAEDGDALTDIATSAAARHLDAGAAAAVAAAASEAVRRGDGPVARAGRVAP